MGNDKDKAIRLLKQNLGEFREIDRTLSTSAKQAVEKLSLFLEDSKLKLSSKERKFIETARENYAAIAEKDDFWAGIIEDIEQADHHKLSRILKDINDTLGNPDSNQAYKKRLQACFWVTQCYPQLLTLIQHKKQKSETKDGVIILGSNKLNEFELTSALSRPFQFLPRQTLFVANWQGYAKDGQLDCENEVASLGRKYRRAASLLNQIIKAIEASKNTLLNSTDITGINSIAATQAMEATPYKKRSQGTSADSSMEPEQTDISYFTPQKTSSKAKKEDVFNEHEVKDAINDMLENNADVSADLADQAVALAKAITDESDYLATPFKPKSTKINLTSPVRFNLDSVEVESKQNVDDTNTKKSFCLTEKNKIAEQAISNIQNILDTTSRPVLGGYFAGSQYQHKDGRIARIPQHEKEIRNLLKHFENKKMQSYHRLATDILDIAIGAEFDTPWFGKRSAETASFYSSMFETLGVDVEASLIEIENLIKKKDKKFWGTRNDYPTTVQKILSLVTDTTKDAADRLKQAIHIAQVASHTNGDMSFFNLRSENTENFYSNFTFLFVKFDTNLIKNHQLTQKDQPAKPSL